ncbi:hypothetical protein NEMIN01_2343 [Nematocida minor]|uniref:uncharacterized protein n=1 Tax=Nematocida minor TaxID=1912983 RepID=UPI002220E96F|nr:uncharacterized protein NEMIN01_2343 [Nematocida minor]KAI5192999.1 hypothetical protein NEMIN01_2343 [Nematocida minor]
MKALKMMKILAGAASVLFFARCSGSSGSSSEEGQSIVLEPSKREMGGIYGGLVCNQNCASRTDRVENSCGTFKQYREGFSVIKHTSACPIGISRLSIGEKRKESSYNLLNACTDHSVPENKKRKKDSLLEGMLTASGQPIKNEVTLEGEEEQPVAKSAKKKNINGFNINLWDNMGQRLRNNRRKGYRMRHRTIYVVDDLDEYKDEEIKTEHYKMKLRSRIEEFAANFAPLINTNAMWYFIASSTTNIHTKYKDLLGLQELFKGEERVHRRIMEGIRGYYPALFEDMIAYIEKHQPLRAKKDSPQTAWKETLGDIYMRKSPAPNYAILEDLDSIGRLDKKCHALVHAVHMALALPEVYQDFSNITESLIKETRISESSGANQSCQEVLLAMRKIVQLNINKETDYMLYKEIYSHLKNVCAEDKKPLDSLTVIELYREIYALLSSFYEKVKVIVAEKEYVLAGKCVIKKQVYIKCEKVVDVSQGSLDKKVLVPTYSIEENLWRVSSNVEPHYHVYYVDNTTQQPRLLCMPFYVDKNNQRQYLHTIDEIVRYIKVLHKIDHYSDYIHPFKVRKGTREWSYVKKGERALTIGDLAEYEVVFYRFEEGLSKRKLAFVEFIPLNGHEEDTLCIPLFLSSLMQSAVEFGPFVAADAHKEMHSIEFENRVPDVYEYDNDYSGHIYSTLHSYYSRLYILLDEEKRNNIECYSMNCRVSEKSNGTVKAVWRARILDGMDEYTHCALDCSFKEKENTENLDAFVDALESREYNRDSELQGFLLQNSNDKGSELALSLQNIYNLTEINKSHNKYAIFYSLKELEAMLASEKLKLKEIEKVQKALGGKKKNDPLPLRRRKGAVVCAKYKQKNRLESICEALSIKKSRKIDLQTGFVVFRRVNHSKSNLGVHNEVLDVLISCYNYQKNVCEE